MPVLRYIACGGAPCLLLPTGRDRSVPLGARAKTNDGKFESMDFVMKLCLSLCAVIRNNHVI